MPATDPWIDDDARSDRKARHALTNRANDPSGVASRYQWKGKTHARHSLPNPDVDVIDRSGPDFQQHVVSAGPGIRTILVPQNIRRAVFVDDDSLHCLLADIMTFDPMDIAGKVALITGSS